MEKQQLFHELSILRKRKEQAIINEAFEEAATIRDKEKHLEQILKELEDLKVSI